ncbi:hypothetical protein CA850_29755 [Micromonospora echinospora]|uniref:Phage tail protein n=1 Tax=Micromonospora echinospora TaxID=1877 RepID=A0A1C5AAV0_MICEC|nr:phage tail domain-containing protein [Micromonospora echinospora]OZV74765.1 hypothetical protein CA850_29755 [Micromonospora echinospora]SCF42362.1 Phage tail protein [Micromonospora echinospora]
MPIVIRPARITPPSTPDVPPISRTPWPELDMRRPAATYIAPDGSVWPLSSPELGWATTDEVTGLGPAPVELVTDPHPRGGDRIRHVYPTARVITWPLLVWGASHLEFLARWRALARAFALTRRLGPGRLRVSRPDGTQREILVHFAGGFEGAPGRGYTDDVAAISLFCEDPYWRAVDPLTLRYVFGTTRPYLNPFPSLSSGRVFGATTATNPGEVETWPEWTVTGPAAGLVAENETTGEAFELTYPLAAGQSIRITTEVSAVVGPAGQPLAGALAWPGSVLWGLDPGLNDINFVVPDAAAGASIELAYWPRFETA